MLPIVVLFDSMQPRTRDTLINGRFVNKTAACSFVNKSANETAKQINSEPGSYLSGGLDVGNQ